MDNSEEQALEAEALESLYVDGELSIIEPNKKFLLSVLPSGCLLDGNGDKCYTAVTLGIEFTPAYPQECPIWSLEDARGMDADQLSTVNELVRATMEANLGMPMVYEVAEAITGFLTQHNKPPSSMHDQMMQQQQKKRVSGKDEKADDEEEDEEDSDYSPSEDSDGEDDSYGEDSDGGGVGDSSAAVGKGKRRHHQEPKGLSDKELVREDLRCKQEEFVQWAEEFRLEMIQSGLWKGSASLVSSEHKTGRQLFETHSKETVEEVAEETQEKVFWGDADLFDGEEVDVDEDYDSAGP
eukprot:GHVS01037409.1.p1 GENE.GHVS01037409.1~~GHVS01037409.1.p1  ORF type:complete len:296 (-),score=77.85 GHVS01037409.1:466-1353(-)